MKSLNVLLVGNYLPDKQESMQRFAQLLQRELEAQGHKVRLIQPKALANRSGAPRSGLEKWLGYIDKFLLFPLVLKRAARRFDIIHICDHSNSPYVRLINKKPHLVTCHDVLAIRSALGNVPENPVSWSGKLLQKIILRGLNRSNHIVCVSENTQTELLQLSTIGAENTSVIYNSINYPYKPLDASNCLRKLVPIFEKSVSISSPIPAYIFHVGGNLWYKNRLGVLHIYQELRTIREAASLPLLVMAGQPFTSEMHDFIAEHHLENLVIEASNCSNEELQALYSSAQVTVFPSLAEGFGWPVIEAQACGCRVMTSNFAPLTEIGGEAAVFCDPRDHAEAAKQLNALLDETEQERFERVSAGLKNACRFSPQKMIEDYLSLYRKLLDPKGA